MNIPTSLIVVLLVAAWLVVLVPMVARRRDRVPQTPADGTRVLAKAKATLRRRPRPGRRVAGAPDGENCDEEALVTVGGRTEHEPVDAADEWASAQAEARARRTSAPQRQPEVEASGGFSPDEIDHEIDHETDDETRDGKRGEPGRDRLIASSDDPVDAAHPADAAESVESEEPALFDETGPSQPGRASAPDEFDETEWEAAQPRADWSEQQPAEAVEGPVSEEELRPVPQRAGRGGFDPEAAEATRAYKYRQRRRITLVLLVLTVVFAVAAPLTAMAPLWIGAAVSFLLLVGYLSYLRRQVRIENAIRQRRMERLQRARQIRPEYGRSRRRPRSGARGREVVGSTRRSELDDLAEFEPVRYRRAV